MVKPKYEMRLNDVVQFAGVLFVIASNCYSLASSVLSIECPGKDVAVIRQQAVQFEFALILYYVSWCRESRAAKEIYIEVARHYQDEVSFAAVDCWHLECNCSRTLPSALGSKKGYPHKWPTLIVYYGRQIALQYRDEWSVLALSRFLSNLIRPVLRLNSKDELKMLNMRSNAVLLGLFQDASEAEYQRFTIAAVKWLENDPEKLIGFAVCLGTAAKDIVKGLGTTTPLIVLVTDKEIQVFNLTGNWKSNHLNSWLQGELKRLSKHFTGFSTPPILLDHVRKGAVLAIFASDQQHSNKNFYIHMSNVMQSFGFFPSIVSIIKNCETLYGAVPDNPELRFYEFQIQKELTDIQNASSKEFCKASLKISEGYGPFMKTNMEYSKRYLMKYQPSAQLESEYHNSAENLFDFFQYNECLKAYQSYNKPELQIVFGKLLTKFIEQISQNSTTRHNRTMSVQIMDTKKYLDILQTLGAANIENFDTTTKTTVMIVEPNQEGVYTLQKPFHYESLLGFIKDYYNDKLTITRKTHSSAVSLLASSTSNFTYYLQDLSRQEFLNRIEHFWQNTTTVLLLYTPRCAFSTMMSHILIQVSALLHNSQQFHHINMVRINTQTNDLPWEFVTYATPALIVFPRGHPSESRLFPTNFKIDVRNVFAFILAQLEPIEQVRVALSSCSPPPFQLMRCLHFARTLALQHIGDHLKLWQIFENERQVILTRLRQFKDITLDIQERFLL